LGDVVLVVASVEAAELFEFLALHLTHRTHSGARRAKRNGSTARQSPE
jgi:hypothetical protein